MGLNAADNRIEDCTVDSLLEDYTVAGNRRRDCTVDSHLVGTQNNLGNFGSTHLQVGLEHCKLDNLGICCYLVVGYRSGCIAGSFADCCLGLNPTLLLVGRYRCYSEQVDEETAFCYSTMESFKRRCTNIHYTLQKQWELWSSEKKNFLHKERSYYTMM